MTSLFFLLLVLSISTLTFLAGAWWQDAHAYGRGLRDGITQGLERKREFILEIKASAYSEGFKQGFNAARKPFKRVKDPVTGRFLRGDEA